MTSAVETLYKHLTEEEQKEAAAYFDVTVESLQRDYVEGDLAIFKDYQYFMYWFLDEKSTYDLIDYIIDEENPYPSDQCYQFKDGRIVFIYF